MKEIIKASIGMILTNGEIFGRQISLPKGFRKEDFYEISEEEYERIMKEQEENAK